MSKGRRRTTTLRLPVPGPKKVDWVVRCKGMLADGTQCLKWWGDNDTLKMDAIELHFDLDHPECEGKIQFELEWRGEGPEPPKPVLNRAQRRRQQRNKKKG